MKIRTSFVSNSSSSSFVVKYKTYCWIAEQQEGYEPNLLLTNQQFERIQKFGFKLSRTKNPSFVEYENPKKPMTLGDFDKWEDIQLTYYLSCNQNDVIYFLLVNKIPFVALCHYDQEFVVYDGKSKYFYEYANIVDKFSRENGEIDFSQKSPPTFKCEKRNVAEFIKREKMYIEERTSETYS